MLVSQFLWVWIARAVACMGGCLGCSSKSTPMIAVREPSSGLKLGAHTIKNLTISEDFLSTSTCEMEISIAPSQRSISSISTATQILDHGAENFTNPTDFVNHGLIHWNQTRQEWVGNKIPEDQQVKESIMSWNATHASLLGTANPFPRSIPLSEMVDFLVDVWEQEGMYD